MVSAAYWASINVAGDDLEYFKRIATRIGNCNTEKKRDAIRIESIVSSEGSFKYKRYITFCMPYLSEARAWGFKNLTGEDLQQLILLLFGDNVQDDIRSSELQLLTNNPVFISSCGKEEFDFLKLIFRDMIITTKMLHVRELLIKGLIAGDRMSIEIAMLIIEANDSRKQWQKIKPYQLEEAPILEWTRKAYQLGDVPDNWVRNLLITSKP